jgi:hypothetical protein
VSVLDRATLAELWRQSLQSASATLRAAEMSPHAPDDPDQISMILNLMRIGGAA